MRMLLALGALLCLGLSVSGKATRAAGDHWIIYRPPQFASSELCAVLNCRHVEVCLVRRNNAICVNKHRLHRIEGTKVELEEASHLLAQAHKSISKPHHSAAKAHHVSAKKHYSASKKSAHPKTNRLPSSSRHSHGHTEKKAEKECSAAELRSMGGRLLQWFSDVHATTKEAKEVHLGRHKVSCRQDVGWMFAQLDGNSDGALSVRELYSLEHDEYEDCIRPFLDRCDVAGRPDDRLSLDEWCDCFNFADRLEREEPPCHKASHSADPHLLGSHVPRCDVDGFFRPEQCHEGMCWCVDRWGREFDHSRVHTRADCGQYAEDGDDEDLQEMDASGAHEL